MTLRSIPHCRDVLWLIVEMRAFLGGNRLPIREVCADASSAEI